MARQDPAKGFVTQEIPEHPVGTLDELKVKNLPARQFGACCEPAFDGSVRGCKLFATCDMSYKGLEAAEGGGPRNHAWQRVKSAANGGGIVRNVHPCFWGVGQQEVALENDEVLTPIADEGQEYERLTTVPDLTKGTNQFGALVYETVLLKETVPAFERLGTTKTMARHELRASIMSQEQKRVADAKKARLLGVHGAGEPLDKRGKGSGGGSKTEGRSGANAE